MMLMMLTTIFLVGHNTSAYTTVNSEGLELELMQAMLEIYVKCERNSVNITVNQLNGKDDCSASYVVQWLQTRPDQTRMNEWALCYEAVRSGGRRVDCWG